MTVADGFLFIYNIYMHIYIYIYIHEYEDNPFFITDLCLLLRWRIREIRLCVFSYYIRSSVSELLRGNIRLNLCVCTPLCVHTFVSHSFPASPRVLNISLSIYIYINKQGENHQTTAMISLRRINSLICLYFNFDFTILTQRCVILCEFVRLSQVTRSNNWKKKKDMRAMETHRDDFSPDTHV